MHSGISCTISLPDLTPRFPGKPKPLSLPVGFRVPRKSPQPKPAQGGARRHAETKSCTEILAARRTASTQSDPSASRRVETVVPAAGFRTFPQRPQTGARTAPVSMPGQNHARKPSPSAAPGTPDRLPRRRLGQGRQRHPGKPMRRPLSVRESGRSKNRIVRSGTIARHPARAG